MDPDAEIRPEGGGVEDGPCSLMDKAQRLSM